MGRTELVAAAETLDADELADLAPDLPQGVIDDVFQACRSRNASNCARRCPIRTVGRFDHGLRHGHRARGRHVEVVLRYLRRFDELPDHTDQLFVVDRDEHLKGVLPLNILLVNEVDVEVATLMQTDFVELEPDDLAEEAAKAFERYDLVSAPVVDPEGKLVGRVTVNEVVDYIREEAEHEQLANAGLKEEEDIFASVGFGEEPLVLAGHQPGDRFRRLPRHRCFRGLDRKLVALAALMPIVAGIGGNSGNQTITMIVRAIAMGRSSRCHAPSAAQGTGRGQHQRPALGRAFWRCRLVALRGVALRMGLVMTAAMIAQPDACRLGGVGIPLLRRNSVPIPALAVR